ncbi:hypothetical protein RFI_17362, partial [Reticulomyxa filosa]
MGNNQECFNNLRITTTQNNEQQSKLDEVWASGTRRKTQKVKTSGSTHQKSACKKKNGGLNGNDINVPLMLPTNGNNDTAPNIPQIRPALVNNVSQTTVNSTATVTSDDEYKSLIPGSPEQPCGMNSGNSKADVFENGYSSAESNDIAVLSEDIVQSKDECIPSKEVCVAIVRTLGNGVSGTVFEVEDQCTRQHYAMKRLP